MALLHLGQKVLFGVGKVFLKFLLLGSSLQGKIKSITWVSIELNRIRIAGAFGALIFLITKYGVMKRKNPVSATSTSDPEFPLTKHRPVPL